MRDSNFELLRIIAMFMVIISHFFVHTDFPYNGDFTLNNIIINVFGIGKIGVALFVLLSGYFLIDAKFSGKKIVRFASQVWFYGLIILLIAYLTGIGEITEKIFFRSVLPFRSTNWFARVYLLLLFVYPVLNYFIKRMTQKRLEQFILIFGFLWTVIPIFSLYSLGNVRITTIYLYVIGAYIKMYGVRCFGSLSRRISVVIVNVFVITISVILITYLQKTKVFLCGREDALLSYNSIFLIVLSVAVFLIFKDMRIQYNEYINKVAQTVFGIYLIHDSALTRNWIWNDIFRGYRFYESEYLLVYGILCSILVFLVCVFIDWFRIQFIERPLFKDFDYTYDYWKSVILGRFRSEIIKIISYRK